MRIHTFVILACLLLSPFQALAQESKPPPPPGLFGADPGAELWREVRQRDGQTEGISQVKSPGANVLINVSGQSWREYRMQTLVPRAGAAVVIVLAMIIIFRIIRGKIPLSEGRSGKKIQRFTNLQRFAHWSTAILFVILAITGMILLFGRTVLIPMFGNAAFGNIAAVSKFLHDYLGPVFMLTLTLLFVLFVRHNIPQPKLDFMWLIKGGGLFGKHVHTPRYNAGEKLWFWVASIGGLAVIISGLVLDFPIFGQTRETMEFYHFVHSISAMVLIVVAMGHIYMGTAALEATFEVMQTGYCDENWAKDHHDLWYDEVKRQQTSPGSDTSPSAPPEPPGQRQSTDTA